MLFLADVSGARDVEACFNEVGFISPSFQYRLSFQIKMPKSQCLHLCVSMQVVTLNSKDSQCNV